MRLVREVDREVRVEQGERVDSGATRYLGWRDTGGDEWHCASLIRSEGRRMTHNDVFNPSR